MSEDRACTYCGHPITLHRCWRLTCPANGGSMELLAIVRDNAERDSAAAGRRVRSGHPSTWGAPPAQEFMF